MFVKVLRIVLLVVVIAAMVGSVVLWLGKNRIILIQTQTTTPVCALVPAISVENYNQINVNFTAQPDSEYMVVYNGQMTSETGATQNPVSVEVSTRGGFGLLLFNYHQPIASCDARFIAVIWQVRP